MPVTPARPLADPAVRSIAIVRLRVGLGDLLCSVPALRAIRRQRPDLHVTVITWDEVRDVLDRQDAYVDELLPFPGYAGIPERSPDTAQWSPFVERCRRRRFDLAVQMYGGQAPANAVAAAVGARRTAGFFTPGAVEADLATHLPYPRRRHEIHRHLELVSFLGIDDVADDRLEFPIGASDEVEADEILARHGLGAFVCVHPGATAPTRRWLPERFAEVADALAAQGLGVVLTGVADEAPLTRAVATAMRAPAVDLAGATSLGGLAALLRRSRLLVSSDTGTAHLAAALAVPSVTVFQAGERARWQSLDRRLHRAVEAGVPCQPCPHQRCPIDLRCATGVQVADVLASAQQLFGERETVA